MEAISSTNEQTELVDEEACPCFYGGSCPTDYKHKSQLIEPTPQMVLIKMLLGSN